MTDIAPSLTLHPAELAGIPTNSNTHGRQNLEELAESRRLFGQFKNVVVWSPPERMEVETADGDTVTLKPSIKYVIAGNGFHQASLERGYDSIEVKDYTDRLTYEEALLLMEADNASPLGSHPNPAQMAANLERARALYADNERMSAMLERARELAGATNGNGTGEGADAEPQVDRAGELAEKWGTALGQVWQLGEHRLVCGDCTDPAVVEAVMRGERADLLFEDPPYGIKRDEGFDGFGGFGPPIARRQYKDDWDGERPSKNTFELHLKHANNSIIFGGNFFADILPQSTHWIVWDKLNTMPTFGDCELAWTNFDRTSVKKITFQYNGLIGKEKQRFHPTQKPLGLYVEILQEYSKGSQVIADYYLGSGTTIIAAHNLQRRARCIEIDPGYVAVSLERFYEATQIEPELL